MHPSTVLLSAWLQRQDTPSQAFRDSITQVLQNLLQTVSTKGRNVAFTRVKNAVSPVEFIFLG
jgi:hypothetical protein